MEVSGFSLAAMRFVVAKRQGADIEKVLRLTEGFSRGGDPFSRPARRLRWGPPATAGRSPGINPRAVVSTLVETGRESFLPV